MKRVIDYVVVAGLLSSAATSCGQSTQAPPSRPVITPSATDIDGFRQEPTASDAIAAVASVSPRPTLGGRTFAALRALENGTGGTVRITWLGDSHTAADFWTGEVRRRLQARFGNAGPGFVSLALGGRRHEVASYKVKGTWKQEPKSGASRRRQLDGKFGLSGRRLHGFPGASLDLKSGVASETRWALLYRVHPSESHAPHLELRNSEDDVLSASDQHEPGFDVFSLERAAGAGPLEVRIRRGQYLVWGFVAESTRPGLVLDALGINGARLSTLLAWDIEAWHDQLAWRKPHLVVLSYGTNETGDGGDMGRYAAGYAEVVKHIQATGADCMLAGPTDRQDDSGRTMPEVEALDAHQRKWAEELGCLYYSPFLAMGGRGGYGQWRQRKPQLAATDGVHLTISGYRFLAEDWVKQLLAGYDGYVASHP